MTAQEIFDTVAAHLLKQDCKSLGKNGGCAYRGKDGTMCAVGCLISGAEYDRKMEGFNAAHLYDKGLLPDGLGVHLSLLEALQIVHDEIDPVVWRRELIELAGRHGLSPEVCKEGTEK